MGYMFLVPYFLVVALIAELTMVGKDTYRKCSPQPDRLDGQLPSATLSAAPYRCGGRGTAIRKWQQAAGLMQIPLNMQLSMVTSPALMLLGIAITAVLAILGTLFGQRLLRKHFQKAGIVG